ncbi:hypothetical protein ACSSS7_000041 [Eimeria intestinalis]
MCCCCLLLLAASHERQLSAALAKWQRMHRAAAATAAAAAASSSSSSSSRRYTPADFVFGVTWATKEEGPPPTWGGPSSSKGAPQEAPKGATMGAAHMKGGRPPCDEPLRLPPEDLIRLGRGPPGRETADGWRRVFSSAETKRKP